MQLEEQNQAVVVSENAPQADSTPIKKQHGGKRAGARRKPNISAEKVLTEISKLAFLDIRKAFNPDGSLKQISELDPETAAAVAGIEHEKLFDHSGRGQAKHVGTTTKIKFASKLQALEMLGRGTSCACGKKTST